MLNKAIIFYRDDLDLQNVIDFGQKEVSFVLLFFFFWSPWNPAHWSEISTVALRLDPFTSLSSHSFFITLVQLLRCRDIHWLDPQYVLQLQWWKSQHWALLSALLLLHHYQRQGSLNFLIIIISIIRSTRTLVYIQALRVTFSKSIRQTDKLLYKLTNL